jgi:hypothetical protein
LPGLINHALYLVAHGLLTELPSTLITAAAASAGPVGLRAWRRRRAAKARRRKAHSVGRPVTTTSAADAGAQAAAVNREAAALLAAYETGSWTPTPEVREFAEGVARGHWTSSGLRTALREATPAVKAGSLAALLSSAARVLEVLDIDQADEMAVLLRQLLDAVATAP